MRGSIPQRQAVKESPPTKTAPATRRGREPDNKSRESKCPPLQITLISFELRPFRTTLASLSPQEIWRDAELRKTQDETRAKMLGGATHTSLQNPEAGLSHRIMPGGSCTGILQHEEKHCKSTTTSTFDCIVTHERIKKIISRKCSGGFLFWSR